MAINSRRKGKMGEREVVDILCQFWPQACRNLDQFGDRKEDVLNVAGVHFQVKRVGSNINIWKALDQTENEARDFNLPVLVFRRDHGRWYGALALDELVALLRLREL
jgi:hypothetical protein